MKGAKDLRLKGRLNFSISGQDIPRLCPGILVQRRPMEKRSHILVTTALPCKLADPSPSHFSIQPILEYTHVIVIVLRHFVFLNISPHL